MEVTKERQEMIDLFTRVGPEIPDPVFSPDDFIKNFQTPFRAAHLTALHKFEIKRKKLFCRLCITRGEKGVLLAHQLWLEESDNLLENKPGEWIVMKCMNEACDFELVTPRPSTPSQGPSPELLDQLRRELSQYPQAADHLTDAFRYGQMAQQAQLQGGMANQFHHAEQMRRESIQRMNHDLAQAQVPPNQQFFQDFSEREQRALSSAKTLGRKVTQRKLKKK